MMFGVVALLSILAALAKGIISMLCAIVVGVASSWSLRRRHPPLAHNAHRARLYSTCFFGWSVSLASVTPSRCHPCARLLQRPRQRQRRHQRQCQRQRPHQRQQTTCTLHRRLHGFSRSLSPSSCSSLHYTTSVSTFGVGTRIFGHGLAARAVLQCSNQRRVRRLPHIHRRGATFCGLYHG